jgi:hypothetical protein
MALPFLNRNLSCKSVSKSGAVGQRLARFGLSIELRDLWWLGGRVAVGACLRAMLL